MSGRMKKHFFVEKVENKTHLSQFFQFVIFLFLQDIFSDFTRHLEFWFLPSWWFVFLVVFYRNCGLFVVAPTDAVTRKKTWEDDTDRCDGEQKSWLEWTYLIGAPDEHDGLSPIVTAYSRIVILSKLTDVEDLVDALLPEDASDSDL